MAKEHQEESKYPRADLIRNARTVFNVSPEAVAGALHGQDNQEFTFSEAKKAIKEFMTKKVK